MRVHILQHVEYEGIGCIGNWLSHRRLQVDYTRFYRGDRLPGLQAFDFLIVMGGPMGVHDTAQYPWLETERQLISAAIAADKTVRGICLGAQLIASALGAPVYRNREPELGWFPVYAQLQRLGRFHFPSNLEVFHWHNDTFDLPEKAVRLASSVACCNQAFQYGRQVIGLQFHLQLTQACVTKILAHAEHKRHDRQRFEQAPQAIRATPAIQYKIANRCLLRLLDYLAEYRCFKTPQTRRDTKCLVIRRAGDSAESPSSQANTQVAKLKVSSSCY
jgi:GMP synthase-like glutamine amidotransferase